MNVLIIDDDKFDRALIIRTFEDADVDITVTQAQTGHEGVEIAKNETFDAIFLDYNLPDINGLDVLDYLTTSQSHENPIIMLSGQEDIELAKKAINKGAYDFFVKSDIQIDRLMRSVSKATHLNNIKIQDKKDKKNLQKLVELDALTGLSNRYDFEVSYSQAFKRAKRGCNLAILLLDIDKFKHVNDTFGHDAGDMLLKLFSGKLKTVVRDSDIVARLGGDEFVILMQDFYENEQVVLLADRILALFQQPISLASNDWNITTSIGIAVYDESISDSDSLLKCADIALYRSKENGRNQSHFYSKSMHKLILNKKRLKKDLSFAVKNNELFVKLSPVIPTNVSLPLNVMVSFYWLHPDLGELDSSQFYDIAIESDLLNDIYPTFLQLSLDLFNRYINSDDKLAGSENYVVSASSQLFLPIFSSVISSVACSNHVLSSIIDFGLIKSVVLTISEREVTTDLDLFATIVKPITDAGIVFALNDFACKLTNLSCFTVLPLSYVFVSYDYIESNVLLSAIACFCKALNCDVIIQQPNSAVLLGAESPFDYCRLDTNIDY